MRQVIPFYGYAKYQYVITRMRASHGMTRKENRFARVPNRVWYTTDYTPVNQDTLQSCGFFENTSNIKFSYTGSKLPTQDINFDMTDYVIHWTKAASFPILLATGLVDNGWKIPETGFNLSEVKNDILFHRVAVNHNQLTNSPQYDAVKVRSDVTIKQPYGKEIGIVIKLSTLVETLPDNIFLTPSGVTVAPHGPDVDDYDKRLVIPADKFHAIQVSAQFNKSPGVSYLLDGLSKEGWSDKATQILAQLTIPDILAEEIHTAPQYVKGLAATSLDEGFTSESSNNSLSSLARHEITMNFMNAEVPIKSPRGKGKGKENPRGQQGGLEIHTPIEFPRDLGLGPDSTVHRPTVLGRSGKQEYDFPRFHLP